MTRNATLIFIGKRLAALVVLLALVSFGIFCLTYIAPGDAVDAYLGRKPRTPEQVAMLTKRFNLDEPFLMQYWLWARDALHLDFGTSNQTTLPVTDEIGARLGATVFLAIYAYVLALLFGIVPGIIAALKKKKLLDRGLVAGAVVTLSTPPFVLGIILLYLFAILVPVFPAAGRGEGFLDQLWHMTLPAVALALSVSAFLLRHTRAAMIGVLEQDYVMFARARGLDWRYIVTRYAFRNALIPVVTASSALLAYFVTGAVLVEATFSLNGLGSLLVSSANTNDLPMIQGLSLLIAAFIVSVNLLADIAYIAVDPRIRLGKGSS